MASTSKAGTVQDLYYHLGLSGKVKQDNVRQERFHSLDICRQSKAKEITQEINHAQIN